VHLPAAPTTPAGRQLRGSAFATAVSTGGTAAASSSAAGNATVGTAAAAKEGGTAIAHQAATNGTHFQAVLAAGNHTEVVEQHGSPVPQADQRPANATTSWEDAAPCPATATILNATVKDESGRVWGWNPANNESCAFKRPVYDLYDVAPRCPANVPRESGVRDESGRLWGSSGNVSCTFEVWCVERGAVSAVLQDPCARLADCLTLCALLCCAALLRAGAQARQSQHAPCGGRPARRGHRCCRQHHRHTAPDG
jgi:hypothetical protein